MKNLENYRKTSLKDKNKAYFQFEKFSDLVQIVEENIGKTNHRGTLFSETPEASYDSFYGTKDIHEAIHLAKYGWQQGIEKMNNKLNISNQDLQFKTKYDVVGGHVSVPRFLNGVPTNMVRKVAVENKDRIITLVKVQSVLGSATSSKMMENAVKFVQIVQNLEAQGYRCNVYIIFASGVHNRNSVVRIKIKNSNERLNLSKMCFPIVHPSTFRRFIFKIREIDKKFMDETNDRYGGSFFRDGKLNERDMKDAIRKIAPYINKGEYLVPYHIENPKEFKLVPFNELYKDNK